MTYTPCSCCDRWKTVCWDDWTPEIIWLIRWAWLNPQEIMADTDIVHMIENGCSGCCSNFTRGGLAQLVDESFSRSVVDASGIFKGLSRASLSLKAVYTLLHDFSKEYEIRCKWETEFQIFRRKSRACLPIPSSPISMIWSNFRHCRRADFWYQSQDLPSPTSQSKNQR